NWLFLTSYKKQRESLLKRVHWNLLVRLGAGAFETIGGEVVQAILLTQKNSLVDQDVQVNGLDVSAIKLPQEKAVQLREGNLIKISQQGLLDNPDAAVTFQEIARGSLLRDFAVSLQGAHTYDISR